MSALLMLVAAPISGAQAPTPPQPSAWVKVCERATATSKSNEENKDVGICLTHHVRVDGKSGTMIVAAALRQIEGQDKEHFLVTMPPGTQVQTGLRATVFPTDIWKKLRTKGTIERSDEADGKELKLDNAFCHATGCTGEIEATPVLISDLRTNGGFAVFAVDSAGASVAFAVPLAGFAEALAGPPVEGMARSPVEKLLRCAGAEWRGCSMKPIPEWGR
jgi:invasion protein IalB